MRILKTSLFVIISSLFFPFCQKEHSIEDGIKKFSSGNWEFREGSTQFAGQIDSAYIEKLAGAKKKMHILGTSLNGVQTFHLNLSTVDSFTVGTYKASLLQVDFQYKQPAKTIYLSDQLVGEFTVNITSLSDNHIIGTFSGETTDTVSNIKTISEGKFSADINLGNNSGTGGINAIGNLGSTSGSCTPVVFSGSYTKGIAMDSSNNILVQVNITKAGPYTISTNLVNGIKFSSTGTFVVAGMQNVLLQAVGIPVNAGNQVFTVTFGSSNCNFTLNFATSNASLDYFPTTPNSNWTYSLEGGTASDSLYISVMTYSPSFGGVEYKSLNTNTIPAQSLSDTQYYRKVGSNYYQFLDLASVLPFDNSLLGEYIFLKDDVSSGTVWNSTDFSGSISGVPVTMNIRMTIIAKSVPVTLGSKNYADVIKVKYDYFISLDPTTPVGTEERWFARGVGLIHDDFGPAAIYNIAYYKVF